MRRPMHINFICLPTLGLFSYPSNPEGGKFVNFPHVYFFAFSNDKKTTSPKCGTYFLTIT